MKKKYHGCFVLCLLVLTSVMFVNGLFDDDEEEEAILVASGAGRHKGWIRAVGICPSQTQSPNRVEDLSRPWPIILWLQCGPGGSGVGIGNFQEIGLLDTCLGPLNSTWLQTADILCVVGTGYSFIEGKNPELFVKTDEDAGKDIARLLKGLFNRDEGLQKSPLYIMAESYGGKFAATSAFSALDAIQAGKLKLILGGVALGDSWISPEDFVFSWAPLLKDVSRMDDTGLEKSKG